MRIYHLDGTYTEENNDFGWSCGEIVIDESVSNYNKRNKEYKALTKLQKSLTRKESLTDSVDSDYEFEITNTNPKTHYKLQDCSKIKMAPIKEVIECLVQTPPINIDTGIPSKENILKLINPYNVENKILLSVISESKFLTTVNEEEFKAKPINYKSTNFRFFLNDEVTDNKVKNELYKEIESYHSNKEDSMLSLMMELILNDMDCTISDIADLNQPTDNNVAEFASNTSDLGNSIASNASSTEENLSEEDLETAKDLPCKVNFNHNLDISGGNYMQGDKTHFLRVLSTPEVLDSLGLSEESRSIQSFHDETEDMNLQVRSIKESFKNEESKINELLEEATSMEKNIKESIYLNNLLHLLNGEVDKVKLEKSAFKIFLKDTKNNEELNLIV